MIVTLNTNNLKDIDDILPYLQFIITFSRTYHRKIKLQ